MQVTSEHFLDDGILERELTLGEIPGIVWTPATATPSSTSPLILLGHPGGLSAMHSRLEARARHSAALGFASAALELPGSGERSSIAVVDQARGELREAVTAGEQPDPDVIDRLVLTVVEKAVPAWRELLDAVLTLPDVSGPVGISGGIIAIGVRLARVEPRLGAAGLFAGSFVPLATCTKLGLYPELREQPRGPGCAGLHSKLGRPQQGVTTLDRPRRPREGGFASPHAWC